MSKNGKVTKSLQEEEQNIPLLEANSVVRIVLDRFLSDDTENDSSDLIELPGSVASASRNRSIIKPGISKSDNSIQNVIIDPEFLKTLNLPSTCFSKKHISNNTSCNLVINSEVIPGIVKCYNSQGRNDLLVQSQNESALEPENIDLFKLKNTIKDSNIIPVNYRIQTTTATFSNFQNESSHLLKPNVTLLQNCEHFLNRENASERISKCYSAPVRRDDNIQKPSRTGSCGPKSSNKEFPALNLIPQESMSSVSSSVCRICMASGRERLISPCNCKGSMGGVHLTCLERWLSQVGRDQCELCGYRYPSIRTPRYTVIQALRIWFGNTRNRNHCQSDCLIFWLLSTVTIGLMAVCVVGTQYFVIEGNRLGISHRITETTMSFFMAIVLFGYFVTIFLLWKDHYVLWTRWRQANVNIRLIIDPNHLNNSETNPV